MFLSLAKKKVPAKQAKQSYPPVNMIPPPGSKSFSPKPCVICKKISTDFTKTYTEMTLLMS